MKTLRILLFGPFTQPELVNDLQYGLNQQQIYHASAIADAWRSINANDVNTIFIDPLNPMSPRIADAERMDFIGRVRKEYPGKIVIVLSTDVEKARVELLSKYPDFPFDQFIKVDVVNHDRYLDQLKAAIDRCSNYVGVNRNSSVEVSEQQEGGKSLSISSNIVVWLGKIAGLAGIAFGVLLLLFKGVLEKDFLPKKGLSGDQAYHIMFAVLLLTFGIAAVGILAWIIGKSAGSVVPTGALVILALLVLAIGLGAVVVGSQGEAKPPDISAVDTGGFVFTTPGNPTLGEMIEMLKQQRHVAITFATSCKANHKNARIQVNGAQLSGRDVPDFLENAIKPRTSIIFRVITIQQDVSYEIQC